MARRISFLSEKSMLEVFISLGVIALMFWVGSVLFSILAFVALIFFVFPGIYSMIFGAPLTITSRKRRNAIIELGNFKKNDVVYDLGCGDGKLIHEISKRGVKEAIGYEFSVPTYIVAVIRKWLVQGRERIFYKNFWKRDYSKATKIVCFLLPNSMRKLKKEIWANLRRGVMLISNDAKLPGIKAEKEMHNVYLYIKK
jgi:hypothetical protein